eukprot:GHVT01012233.1.p1 GENE.GHVT01012233.1~~GHVT01012233.1.p1  ORF type:complete len:183 (-),score=34.72 GHVT01012233.1:695-1243(-)
MSVAFHNKWLGGVFVVLGCASPFLFPGPFVVNCSDLRGEEITIEVEEMLRVMRVARGLETNFNYSDDLRSRLDKYLDLLEYRLHLDPEFDEGPPENSHTWSSLTPFSQLNPSQQKVRVSEAQRDALAAMHLQSPGLAPPAVVPEMDQDATKQYTTLAKDFAGKTFAANPKKFQKATRGQSRS